MNAAGLPDCVHLWLAEPLPSDVQQSLARLATLPSVQHVAVMPDVHLAKEVCVGVALATRDRIYPHAVGGDIGCGMAAVAFDADADVLDGETAAAQVLADLYRLVPWNRHAGATKPTFPDDLTSASLSDPRLERLRGRDGLVQFGTLGRGNHFIELQRDQENRLWLMVHSGSRGMGQAITAHHLERADTSYDLPSFEADSDAGLAYLNDVAWAVEYAMESRLRMTHAVAEIMQSRFGIACDWPTLIHGNHNHVRREERLGTNVYVHRKGALPAFEGELGVIPGSMGTKSFHVSGRGCEEALCSSSHGAGRTLSRVEARKQVGRKQLLKEMGGVWFDQRRVDALRDEAPSAYKDIGKVMRAQKDLTRIVRELRPVLCYKGV